MKAAVSEIAQVAAKTETTERFEVQPKQESSGQRNRLSETLAYIEKKENNAIQEKLDSLQTLLEQKLQPQEEESPK